MNKRIVVVGGGIAGLAAAHRLLELNQERSSGLEVTLCEAAPRLGGSIQTERVGDFLVEAGPDSFISEKPWALELCERLGLASRLISTNPEYQKIYVVHKGALQPLPEGFFLLAPTRAWPLIQTPLFSWQGKLRMALELLLPRGKPNSDESLASFVRRRFGSEMLERVAQPLIGGIYAADPEKLSLNSTMPRFAETERERRSITWAMWSAQRRRSRAERNTSGARWSLFVSLAGGMRELIDALSRRFPVGSVHLGIRGATLEKSAEKPRWTLVTSNGEKIDAEGVLLAAPAYAAADIVDAVAPELARELRFISYASTVAVNLGFRRADFPRPLDGFGLIVPTVERRKIIACTFSSLKYAGRAAADHLLLRAFVGGALRPDLTELDDHAMEALVREELADLLGIQAPPLLCRIYRHCRSMPQYHVGHQERIRRVEAELAKFSGLGLAGNAYHGIGIADCVHSGEKAAEKLVENLNRKDATA